MYTFTLGSPESIAWAFLLVFLLGPIISFPSRPPDRRYAFGIGFIPFLLMAALLITNYLTVVAPAMAVKEVVTDRDRHLVLLALAGGPVLALGMVIAYIRRRIARN